MPLIFFAANGQILVGISASVRMVKPSGFSSSEPIFANNLFGAMQIEQLKFVAAFTAFLIVKPSVALSSM